MTMMHQAFHYSTVFQTSSFYVTETRISKYLLKDLIKLKVDWFFINCFKWSKRLRL